MPWPSKEAKRAYDAGYYAARREEMKARVQAYRTSNKEKVLAYSRQWYAENRKRAMATVSAYRKANPNMRRLHSQNRLARKRGSGGRLSPDLFTRLMRLQRGKCVVCHTSLFKSPCHMDHIMPLALDGEHADRNMQLLCAPCNVSKNARHPVDFMQQRGFLL